MKCDKYNYCDHHNEIRDFIKQILLMAPILFERYYYCIIRFEIIHMVHQQYYRTNDLKIVHVFYITRSKKWHQEHSFDGYELWLIKIVLQINSDEFDKNGVHELYYGTVTNGF